MALTGEGRRLKERADGLVREMDAFRAEAESLRGGGRGDVVLGVNTDPRLLRLKDVHAELAGSHPGISLVVKETMSWEVEAALHAGAIDLGFSYFSPATEGVGDLRLGEVPLAVVAPEAWRARLENAEAGALAAFPWVWTSGHCPMNAVLTRLFDAIGARPDKAVVVDQESAILKLVADGLGLGVMPAAKAEAVAGAYGIFPVLVLEESLALHLLYLKRRMGEGTPAALLGAVGRVWA